MCHMADGRDGRRWIYDPNLSVIPPLAWGTGGRRAGMFHSRATCTGHGVRV